MTIGAFSESQSFFFLAFRSSPQSGMVCISLKILLGSFSGKNAGKHCTEFLSHPKAY